MEFQTVLKADLRQHRGSLAGIFLLILFADITKIKLITEENNPIAVVYP